MPIDEALRMELEEIDDGSQEWKKTEAGRAWVSCRKKIIMRRWMGESIGILVPHTDEYAEADVSIAKWANWNPTKPPKRIAAGERPLYREASISGGEEPDAIFESDQSSDVDSCMHEWDDGITLPSIGSDEEHDPETIADYNDDLSGQGSYAQIYRDNLADEIPSVMGNVAIVSDDDMDGDIDDIMNDDMDDTKSDESFVAGIDSGSETSSNDEQDEEKIANEEVEDVWQGNAKFREYLARVAKRQKRNHDQREAQGQS
ncbi:hypothetical protein CDEST_01092 [Colletotrichum destructivum]|uniref:Uncharacterized protein n=1 Tax=Colletotrichum destructivum TaxID=34406 RepID=A0AAX4HZ16_9PEZI|nr:hypothetical protein CDEST_01092 [Colletotrichum destructivum]